MHKRLRVGRTLLSATFEVAFDFKKSKIKSGGQKSAHICSWKGSERQTQRHLNLPRASDRFIGDTQTAQVRAHIQRSGSGLIERRVTRTQSRRRALLWEALEAGVLRNVIDRDIEARRVGQVVDIETVLQRSVLGDLRHLNQRKVRASLPGLPKDIALAMIDEVRLVRI